MTEKTSFTVNDMTCGHCVGTVRKALAKRPELAA
ncbi:MAG: cation transporter [Devosia sp.]|jgi:copper chaperone|nr:MULTISPECIES: cation transporter [unclassified Devosia]MBF0677990.1 cation transporter [Devosia sp.]WEJ32424.1 cation transporter [Devosia sp. SD17-2]